MTRDQVGDQVFQATTLAEVEDAWQLLRGWLRDHPEDEDMRDLFEPLYVIRDELQRLAAETPLKRGAVPELAVQ